LKLLGRVPLITDLNDDNADYLRVKREKLGHLLDEPELSS